MISYTPGILRLLAALIAREGGTITVSVDELERIDSRTEFQTLQAMDTNKITIALVVPR